MFVVREWNFQTYDSAECLIISRFASTYYLCITISGCETMQRTAFDIQGMPANIIWLTRKESNLLVLWQYKRLGVNFWSDLYTRFFKCKTRIVKIKKSSVTDLYFFYPLVTLLCLIYKILTSDSLFLEYCNRPILRVFRISITQW